MRSIISDSSSVLSSKPLEINLTSLMVKETARRITIQCALKFRTSSQMTRPNSKLKTRELGVIFQQCGYSLDRKRAIITTLALSSRDLIFTFSVEPYKRSFDYKKKTATPCRLGSNKSLDKSDTVVEEKEKEK